jgi:hypothetical protein
MKITHCLTKGLLAALVFISISACDDEATIPESPKPDAEALNKWFDTNVENQEQHFTLSAGT